MSEDSARTRLLLLAILVATFALHLLVMSEPFGRDQGIFAYIGETLLRGGVPYRDAWDHKTPGIYAVYALAFSLFGRGMPSLHLFEGFVLTVTTFFVYRVGRKLHSDAVGLLGALLYGVSATLLFEWWDRGQAEIYMALTGTLAVWFLTCYATCRDEPRVRPVLTARDDMDEHKVRPYGPGPSHGSALADTDEHKVRPYDPGTAPAPSPQDWGGRGAINLALCGFFCGLTIYFKPTGLPVMAGLALAVAILLWQDGLRRVIGALVAMGAGFALSFIPLLAYFAANGALGDLYQTVIVFNTYHARIGGNPTLAGNLTGTLDFLSSMNILTPLAAVGLWAVLRGRAGLRPAPTGAAGAAFVILPLWLVASAAGIWTQGKFFSYHWSPVLPPLALLAAWGLQAIARELRSPVRSVQRGLAALVCIAVIAVYAVALGRDHAPKWTRDLDYALGKTSPQAYLANFSHNIQGRDIYSFSQTQEAATYLNAHSAPDDTVLVWGFQALVNYLAERRAPTRYIFTYPLTFDRPESEFRVQARRTFLHDLRDQPPLYIVLVTNDVNPLQAVDSYGLLADFPEFQQILQQRYRIETDIGEFHIYRRIDA